MKHVLFFALVLTLGVGGPAFAQGSYLNRGESGFGVGGSIVRIDGTTSGGGTLFYSHNGMVDLGLTISQLGRYYWALGGALSGFLIKQSDGHPGSLALFVSYEKVRRIGNENRRFWGAGLGVGAAHRFDASPVVQITPGISYGMQLFNTTEIGVKNEIVTTMTGTLGLGVSVLSRFLLLVEPGLAYSPQQRLGGVFTLGLMRLVPFRSKQETHHVTSR